MRLAPVLHFSGHFRFQMPEMNNDPASIKVPFDPNKTKEEVIAICGCNPAKYYAVEFFDTTVTQVTYSDGSASTVGDPVLGEPVLLTGFLPDVCPSAICARLFAGRLRVGTALRGALSLGVQSDLRLSIRPEGFGDETAAAHYEQRLKLSLLQAPIASRYFSELGTVDQLEVCFHVNHYTRVDNPNATADTRLTGDVYGCIRPVATDEDDAFRTFRRRLVAHPDLPSNPTIESTYLTNTGPGSGPISRITDIDGWYDLSREQRLLCLRYLDFVPFLDRNYATPQIDRYRVYFVDPATNAQVDIGEFRGDHGHMLQTGGCVILPVPPQVFGAANIKLTVDVVKDGNTQPLMIESEWDLLLEGERGATIPSRGRHIVDFRVYKNNVPVAGHAIRLKSQAAVPPGNNRRSPLVATFATPGVITDANGRASAAISAIDANNAGGVFDPITGQNLATLPWDRYYGNYVYAEIDNALRRATPAVEQIEIAVRVVHSLTEAGLPAIPRFSSDIKQLVSYYVRYFPWIHVREFGDSFERIFDLEDYDDVVSQVDEIIRRLELDDHDREKMPRSRDFPIGGVDMLKRWRDNGMPN